MVENLGQDRVTNQNKTRQDRGAGGHLAQLRDVLQVDLEPTGVRGHCAQLLAPTLPHELLHLLVDLRGDRRVRVERLARPVAPPRQEAEPELPEAVVSCAQSPRGFTRLVHLVRREGRDVSS